MKQPDFLEAINAAAPEHGAVSYQGSLPFGDALHIEAFELSSGLRILICEDHSAPVLAFHTWFRIGSRHEQPGKTGLAHLFEHLMFNETTSLAKGEFDRRLEGAGADSNASTWLDWTQYNVAVPSGQLPVVIELESDRMAHLVLKAPQVESEIEVVANERRYRVEDDIDGAMSELLWATAFEKHAYRWPTIGWMADILAFTTEDCDAFYRSYYAPNNATVIVVGDVTVAEVVERISQAYGKIGREQLPLENNIPEPAQNGERRVEIRKATATDKISIGYHSPALGDYDYAPMNVLSQALLGGRASRLQKKLVREHEAASDARIFLGPFRDPGLLEIYASARTGKSAEDLLEIFDPELRALQSEPLSCDELTRAKARMELGLYGSLETVDGKANSIGFYEAVLQEPAAAFQRQQSLQRVTASDVLRVARRYLNPENRSIVIVRPDSPDGEVSTAEDNHE